MARIDYTALKQALVTGIVVTGGVRLLTNSLYYNSLSISSLVLPVDFINNLEF